MKTTLHRKTLLKIESLFVGIYSLTVKCTELCLTWHLHSGSWEGKILSVLTDVTSL